MHPPREDRDRRDEGPRPSPPPSARVRLEIDILAGEHAVPAPVASDGGSLREDARTVLVVAADADLRRYITDCLRPVGGLRLLEASRAGDARALLTHDAPHLVVVDAPERAILAALRDTPVILLANAVRRVDPLIEQGRLVPLAPPFTPAHLTALAVRLLA